MPKSTRQIQVLIADDHPLFRFGLKKFLESQPDLRVVGEAQDGHQALELVRVFPPDILLLDLAMPRLPGLETLRELMDAQSSIRTIVLTAAIEKQQMAQVLQLGARGVVLKDTATEVLLKAIRAVDTGLYWVGRESVASLADTLRTLAPAHDPAAPRHYGLTPRELDIVTAIVTGCSNKQVAQQFSISEITVKHHLSSIFDKVGVSSRLELALFALEKGLVTKPEPTT
jgi:DNA-binding NarL/FixJ family response regulator